MDKRLNMEFDWKRRPHLYWCRPEHGHLRYDTVPGRPSRIPDGANPLWSNFQRAGKACLKTVDDYERFSAYANARASKDNNSRVFVDDGDQILLKQSLCRAWKQSLAGLVYREGAATANGFATLLTSCGIRTKRHDVENAALRAFEPHAVPRSSRCLRALEEVSQRFPAIQVEEVLANEEDALFPSLASDMLHPTQEIEAVAPYLSGSDVGYRIYPTSINKDHAGAIDRVVAYIHTYDATWDAVGHDDAGDAVNEGARMVPQHRDVVHGCLNEFVAEVTVTQRCLEGTEEDLSEQVHQSIRLGEIAHKVSRRRVVVMFGRV